MLRRGIKKTLPPSDSARYQRPIRRAMQLIGNDYGRKCTGVVRKMVTKDRALKSATGGRRRRNGQRCGPRHDLDHFDLSGLGSPANGPTEKFGVVSGFWLGGPRYWLGSGARMRSVDLLSE